MKKKLKFFWKLKSTVCLKYFLSRGHVFRVRAFVDWKPSSILQMQLSTETIYCTAFSITQFLQCLTSLFEVLCLYTLFQLQLFAAYCVPATSLFILCI